MEEHINNISNGKQIKVKVKLSPLLHYECWGAKLIWVTAVSRQVI